MFSNFSVEFSVVLLVILMWGVIAISGLDFMTIDSISELLS